MSAIVTCSGCGHSVNVSDEESHEVTGLPPVDDCTCDCHGAGDSPTLSVAYE